MSIRDPCMLWCKEKVFPSDDYHLVPHAGEEGSGMRPWHRECWVRALLGGINHIKGTCTCCGGSQPPDPPGLNAREAATLVLAYYNKIHHR
jgi:hypothetical protein